MTRQDKIDIVVELLGRWFNQDEQGLKTFAQEKMREFLSHATDEQVEFEYDLQLSL